MNITPEAQAKKLIADLTPEQFEEAARTLLHPDPGHENMQVLPQNLQWHCAAVLTLRKKFLDQPELVDTIEHRMAQCAEFYFKLFVCMEYGCTFLQFDICEGWKILVTDDKDSYR